MRKLILLFVLVPTVVLSQQLSQEEKEILTLQDQRSTGDGRLGAYLAHANETLRYRAAIAFANLQDTSSVGFLLPLLKDPSGRVRAAAAFALGQIGSRAAEDSLLAALQRETDPLVFGRIAEALGRCGGEDALQEMVEMELSPAVESARDQFVLAIGRFALRGVKTERSIWFCFDQLEQTNPNARWAALFALWRLAPLRIIDIEIARRFDELKKRVTDQSADVRIHLATLLGRSRVTEAVDLLKLLSTAEQKQNDWRVQVALVRSFGALAPTNPELISNIVSYLKSQNDHVAIAALQVVGSLSPATVANYARKKELETELLRLSRAESRAELVRGEALVALGRHFPSQVNTALLADPKQPLRVKAKVLEALSFNQSADIFKLFLRYLEDDSIRVAMAAWDFFRRIAVPFQIQTYAQSDTTLRNIQSILAQKIISALNRNDMAITNLVANTVGDTLFFSLFQGTEWEEKVRQALTQSYKQLSSPDDVEAMQAVLDALGRIGNQQTISVLESALHDPDRTVAVVAAASLQRLTGQDYSSKIPAATKPLFTDYDWQTFESISPQQFILLKTTKGTITLQLLKDHAPFTVLSFFKLVRKGFYNGLAFHRVVPNFVIQGGDPRSDGWGGPGYAIRSEYSLVNYERGMVGMASAGKDTEGCQFFIVHSPQPHLDGRYTIFARVTEGMDVVDKIQVGDRILSAELVP
ncbi:MAG TPA: peptidylprolyl isomerase [Bacteroidota bacterium]|nr:peptidylprolyl isomerase [Bacteroidota bacterium]